ncbi:uncharacterized protein BBOV_IV011530 [Babesia bovis T2Bo]|uniref:SPRY domain-containing protein n=1 Tax=Babesia bovis TaxID=5865 RepID=A7ASI6_BABBO|nr:uncharacterized protein BBOV_IV011530 [Babesia bovis T2Bo]EDO07505.1 hypothetical protein BBOV_IV011530 [Babesia bovis T2Bo]|eukprot:XP_001611073.1 hypothetical protein [Babesia bovis T2Bo]
MPAEKPKKAVDLALENKKQKIIFHPDLEYNSFDVRYAEVEPPAKISEDRLTYTGSTLWCTALTRGCATTGNWYFECKIGEPIPNWRNFKLRGWDSENNIGGIVDKNPHLESVLKPCVRVGYGARLARFESPLGSNAFSCAIGQDKGRIYQHDSIICPPEDLMDDLKPGDIIGCALKLGTPTTKVPDPRAIAYLWAFVKKGLLAEVSNPNALEELMVINKDSELRFSVNGVWRNTVVKDLYCVEYHPAVSTFMGASCTLIVGPEFNYAPPDNTYKPVNEMTNSEYPCKGELLKFWILGDTSVLSEGAVINREYHRISPKEAMSYVANHIANNSAKTNNYTAENNNVVNAETKPIA